MNAITPVSVPIPPPMGMLAELTHRCPLQCPYCANPLELERAAGELDTATWQRVLREAAALGVLQVHFSGGEPMARRDLLDLVRTARDAGMYSNLITSGVTLNAENAAALREAGLDHIQLSFQDAEAEGGDRIGGYAGGHAKKLVAAKIIKDTGFALTTNFVVHRQNLARVGAMIELGAALGATRIEIAHTQYYGWALVNRAVLMPEPEQVATATAAVEAAREQHAGKIVIDYVVPDYYAQRPKACMGGWAQRLLNISPSGKVLPCHAAETLPMHFPNVRDFSLAEIWTTDPAFQRFRGTDWMPEPCSSCARKELDWGGCRCQAFALLGDMTATDPACAIAPGRAVLEAALAVAQAEARAEDARPVGALTYRRMAAAPGAPAGEKPAPALAG